MKAVMADNSDCFTIGSLVVCETLHNKRFEGDVLAFDPQTRILVLKCRASNGKSTLCDVHMVNLNYVSDVTIKQDGPTNPPQMQSINLQRLNFRVDLNRGKKSKMTNDMAANVSPEGQRLFLCLCKTHEDVTWKGENIVVLNQVTISPPYRPENCKGTKSDDQDVTHIRKIVEKHYKDQQLQLLQQTSNQSSSGTPPPTNPNAQL